MINYLMKKETLQITLLTAFVYVSAYFFEAAQCHYYGVPAFFVSVGVKSIVISILAISFGMAIILALNAYFIKISLINSNYTEFWLWFFCGVCVCLTFTFVRYLNSGNLSLEVSQNLVLLLLLFLNLVKVAQVMRKIPSKLPSPLSPRDFLRGKLIKLTDHVLNVFLFVIFLFSFCFYYINSVGLFLARETQNFNSFEDKGRNFSIVKIYDDNVLAREVRDDYFVGGAYVFKVEDLKGKQLKEINFKKKKQPLLVD